MVVYLKIFFHPYQPTFGWDEVFHFFHFFLNLVPSSSKPQKPETQVLCEIFQLHMDHSEMPSTQVALPPKKINFLNDLSLRANCF